MISRLSVANYMKIFDASCPNENVNFETLLINLKSHKQRPVNENMIFCLLISDCFLLSSVMIYVTVNIQYCWVSNKRRSPYKRGLEH